MTFTYDGTLDTNLEKVRLEIGDTDSTDAQFTDAEITYFLTEAGNVVIDAAIRACDALATKYSREYDFQTDDQRFSRSQKAAAYRQRAADLRERAGSGLSVTPQTKVDGYSNDKSTHDVSTSSSSGRASVGYFNPDRSY